MSTMTLPDVQPADPSVEDDLYHSVCCDPDIAICGLDVSGHPFIKAGPDTVFCPMCAYIDDNDLPCPVPGCTGWTA